MTQADFTIANQTFPNTRTELNTSLQALATNSAGNSAPSTTFPSQWHYDSDGNQLYIRNKDNDAWVKVFTIGATSDKVDSIADSIAIASTGGVTITTADNTDTLTLISTDTDANAGPNLHLYRNQGTDEGDDDVLGQIKFSGRNDNAQDVLFYRQDVQSSDVSDGAEDGQVRHLIMINGSETEFLRMNPAGVVFNEGGVAGSDFRVESDGNANMLFVDAGNDKVGIGTSSPSNIAHIAGSVSGTTPVLRVENSNSDGLIGFKRTSGTPSDDYIIGADSTRMYFRNNTTGNDLLTIFEGGGIAIGSTDAANTLDDYEEGTWTVELATGFSGSNGYQTREARYTKIGRMVYCHISFRTQTSGWTANGSSLTLSGLPFTTLNSECRAGGCSSYSSMPVLGSGANTIQFYGNNNATTVDMYVDGDTGLAVNSGVDISGKYIIGQFFYETA